MKGLLRGLLNSGTTSLKNHWWILIPFLSLGGIIGTQSIEMLHLEKLQEDTTQLKNLLTLEYHLSFILIGLHMITGFMIRTIHGTGTSYHMGQGYNDANNLIHTLETSIRWRSRNE